MKSSFSIKTIDISYENKNYKGAEVTIEFSNQIIVKPNNNL